MRKHAVIAGRAGQFYRIEEITAAAFCRAGADASISLSAGDARSCDLLVVPGGFNDVNPALYGMPNTTSHEVTPEMDELQWDMIRAAADAGKPVLGICRGCQLLNVFFGGTLTQEVSHTDVHQIELVPGKPVTVLKRHDARNVPSRRAAELCGVKCVINSGHHQGICRLGRELQIEQLWFPEDLSARERREIMDEARASGRVSADAGEKYIIEMYSHKSLPIIGVQWHPEMLAEYPDEPAVDGTAFLRNVLDRTCGAQRRCGPAPAACKMLFLAGQKNSKTRFSRMPAYGKSGFCLSMMRFVW